MLELESSVLVLHGYVTVYESQGANTKAAPVQTVRCHAEQLQLQRWIFLWAEADLILTLTFLEHCQASGTQPLQHPPPPQLGANHFAALAPLCSFDPSTCRTFAPISWGVMAAPKPGAGPVNQLDSKVAMTQSFDRTAGRKGKGKAITQTGSLSPLICVAIKSSEGSRGSDLTQMHASASITARLLDWQEAAREVAETEQKDVQSLSSSASLYACVCMCSFIWSR